MIFHKYLNAIFAVITAICFALCLVGCAAKKEIKKKQKTSVETSKIEYVSQPIKTSYEVKLECDTVSGKVKPVSAIQTSGKNKANFDIKNNRLSISLATGKSRYLNLESNQKKETEKSSDIIRYKVSPWHWLFHLVAVVVIFLLIKISSLTPFKWIKSLYNKFF